MVETVIQGRVERDLEVFRAESADLGVSSNDIFEGGTVSSGDISAVALSIARMRDSQVRSSLVRFEPGARTRFHTHAGDQILIVVEGRGHIGRAGLDVDVGPGDVVVVPAGLPHYHGAGSESAMAHLTVLFGAGTEIADSHRRWPPQGE